MINCPKNRQQYKPTQLFFYMFVDLVTCFTFLSLTHVDSSMYNIWCIKKLCIIDAI